MEESEFKSHSSFAWLTMTRASLDDVLIDFVHRKLPHRRISKLAGLLLLSSQPHQRYPEWASPVIGSLLESQKPDGGWVDCEDTAWCSFVLQSLGHREGLKATLRWLEEERSGDAWGYCRRDAPCIPISSTIRLLSPTLWDSRSASWLRSAWSYDFHSPFRLSYKSAWYLLAGKSNEEDPLQKTTKEFLMYDQKLDGGWGPWRDHPAPSDCFCTGIAMWALAFQKRDEESVSTLYKALQWCSDQCLPNGLFPTHFIEEGSAWLYLGCYHALKHLEGYKCTGDQSCADL